MPRSPDELPLTPRQWEVVQKIRQGKTYEVIGEELDPPVTDKTVSNLACRAAERIPGKGPPKFKIITCSAANLKKARERPVP